MVGIVDVGRARVPDKKKHLFIKVKRSCLSRLLFFTFLVHYICKLFLSSKWLDEVNNCL